MAMAPVVRAYPSAPHSESVNGTVSPAKGSQAGTSSPIKASWSSGFWAYSATTTGHRALSVTRTSVGWNAGMGPGGGVDATVTWAAARGRTVRAARPASTAATVRFKIGRAHV